MIRKSVGILAVFLLSSCMSTESLRERSQLATMSNETLCEHAKPSPGTQRFSELSEEMSLRGLSDCTRDDLACVAKGHRAGQAGYGDCRMHLWRMEQEARLERAVARRRAEQYEREKRELLNASRNRGPTTSAEPLYSTPARQP